MIELSGGSTSADQALLAYQKAWKSFLATHHVEQLNQLARATTLSWKVADKAALFANMAALAARTEQVHIGTVNDRFIASLVLHEPIAGELRILKILERRADSSDPLGLDSLDYIVADTEAIFQLLQTADAAAVKEHNDIHAWLSLRFGDKQQFEAKFTDHTVLAVAVKELRAAATELGDELNEI